MVDGLELDQPEKLVLLGVGSPSLRSLPLSAPGQPLRQVVEAIRAFPAGELRNSRNLMEKLLRRVEDEGTRKEIISEETDKEIEEIVFWFQAENETPQERHERLARIFHEGHRNRLQTVPAASRRPRGVGAA